MIDKKISGQQAVNTSIYSPRKQRLPQFFGNLRTLFAGARTSVKGGGAVFSEWAERFRGTWSGARREVTSESPLHCRFSVNSMQPRRGWERGWAAPWHGLASFQHRKHLKQNLVGPPANSLYNSQIRCAGIHYCRIYGRLRITRESVDLYLQTREMLPCAVSLYRRTSMEACHIVAVKCIR